MSNLIWCLILTPMLVITCSAAPVGASDSSDLSEPLRTLRDRLVSDSLVWPSGITITDPHSPDADPEELFRTLGPDGRWPDLDFADPNAAAWPPMKHLTRMLELARAYRHPDSSLRNDPELRERVLAAIDFWLQTQPRSGNWWWNRIGGPRTLGRTLILLDAQVSPAQREAGIAYMDTRDEPPGTGQNRLWLEEIALMLGVLERDPQKVAQTWEAIQSVIHVAPGRDEGIKPDMSFHQHGERLMSGSYGMGFAIDTARLASIASGTPYAFAPEKMALISGYLLDGQRWMMRGAQFDHSAMGREITRPHATAHGRRLGMAIRQFLDADPPRKAALADLAARIEAGDPALGEPFVGNRHFWYSDYMAHHRPGFFLSVRMTSTRVRGSELVNGEGLKSLHLGDGVTLLYRHGDEYDGIFGVWNWRRLPGVTTEQTDAPWPRLPFDDPRWLGASAFVGGVSDGHVGLAAMDFDRDGVSARKSWACLGDVVVALGAAIDAPDAGAPVFTTLNQTLQRGPVTLPGEGPHEAGEWTLDGPTWVHHDGVGYVLLDAGERLTVRAEEQTGSWREISAAQPPQTQRLPVFTAWIDHGRTPADATYAYLLAPDRTAAQTAALAQAPPVSVLRNDRSVQAVRHDPSGLMQAAFYAPARLELGQGRWLEVAQPALVMLRPDDDGGWILSAADPARKTTTLTISLNAPMTGEGVTWRPSDGVSRIQLDLPTGEAAGSTRTLTLRRR